MERECSASLRRNRGSGMANARRQASSRRHAGPRKPPPRAPEQEPRPLCCERRVRAPVDAKGFTLAASRHRWRRRLRTARPWPVLATFVGLCFNCMAEDNVAADCRFLSWCLHCRGTRHHARECKRDRSPAHHTARTRDAPRRRLLS